MSTTASQQLEIDHGYAELERIIRERPIEGPLFTTDTQGLWEAYLFGIPEQYRQHYNCRRCREFIERYGGLVRLDAAGNVSTSIVWGVDVPTFFLKSFVDCGNLVAKAKVTGVFLSSDLNWGIPWNLAGPGSKCAGTRWTHLSRPNPCLFRHPVLTADQRMAEMREEHGMLCRGLADYPLALVEQAVRVLDADAVYRSEKAVGVANWLLVLHQRIDGVKGLRRSNLIWQAVATAPPGFCHIRSTVISTLLDDIAVGMDMDAIKRRWAEKLHPLQYQRPSAPPSEGTIRQAEALVEKLGVARSLLRRYATLDDVLKFEWRPAPEQPQPQQAGVFDHLRAKKDTISQVELPEQPITWDKFRRTVLPTALRIEAWIPEIGSYYGLVTAVDPEAPPVLQWDGLVERVDSERWEKGTDEIALPRNPVSWYFHAFGSSAVMWSLDSNVWVSVTAVFLSPEKWQQPERFNHFGDKVMFALEDCRDTSKNVGLALFPECLKTEFHGIRSVIEAHGRTRQLEGQEQGNANGIAFQGDSKSTLRLRVTTEKGKAVHRLDRWD